MSDDRVLRFGSLATARAVRRRIAAALGLPRCNCPAHGGTPIAGSYPPCPCTSATGAGVSQACPHITRVQTRLVRHPSAPGVVGVFVDDATWAMLTAPERATVDALDHGEWEGGDADDD